MSNILKLRVIGNDVIDDAMEKPKSKRGRPRKNLTPDVTQPETTIIPKKRGRKRKSEQSSTESKKPVSEPITMTKSYIVQFKIKSTNLDKIQQNFIAKSKKVGYDTNQSHPPVGCEQTDTPISSVNCDEYYNLLNKLEMPLIPVAKEISAKILPNIPNMYRDIVIPISPENVPSKLFDNQDASISSNNIRNTSTILLPLLFNNDTISDKSPYACWNCDTYFTGSPLGIPEKEVDGKFHCYGNFCSFECTARYLLDHELNNFYDKYSLLCVMYQTAYNLPPETKVLFAPPKITLHKYGGPLSYEQYHNMSNQGTTVETYKLPLIPVMVHIGDIYRSTNMFHTNQQTANIPPNQSNPSQKIKRVIPIDPHKMSQAEKNVTQHHNNMLQSQYTLDKCLCQKT